MTIEINLNTPNGPIVEYGPDDDAESVDLEMPPDWRVDWATPAYKLASGRFRSPLVAQPHVYKIQYQSTVCVYAEHEIRASSPEEAAVIAAQWINGNVSALDWTDVDGDAIGGEVERGNIPFSVYEGGDEGAPLGDDEDLLTRAREKGIHAP
jgi:hypothetical protein